MSSTDAAEDSRLNADLSAVNPGGDDVKINVKTLHGTDFELTIPRDMSVSDLKTHIRERTDVAEGRQRLIYRGRVLLDAEPISTYKIEDGHSLHMVPRPEAHAAQVSSQTESDERNNSHSDTTNARSGADNGDNGPGTLGQRLLMGMGLPFLPQGVQADNGAGGTGEGRRAIAGEGAAENVLNAAGLDGSALLQSILGHAVGGIGGLDGSGGGASGASPINPPDNARQRSGRPGHNRDSPSAGRVTVGGSGSAESEAEQGDLEHVRQGLLTLHTLLSGTARRRRDERRDNNISLSPQRRGVEHTGHPTSRSVMDHRGARIASDDGSFGNALGEGRTTPLREADISHLVPTSIGMEGADTAPSQTSGGADSSQESRAEVSHVRSTQAASFASDAEDDFASKASVATAVSNGDLGRETEEAGNEVREAHASATTSNAERDGKNTAGTKGVGGLRSVLHASRTASSSRSTSDRELLSGEPLNSLSSINRRYEAEDHQQDGTSEEKGADEEDKVDAEPEAMRRFFVGQWLDVKDTVNNWLEATVMDICDSGTKLQIHYNGWPPRWDEWISWDSPRIAPFRTRTHHLPHAQHVSPAPISAVHNAPITGRDDVRIIMPEISRVLGEIAPMVNELSERCASSLEPDLSSPQGDRSVSHSLPWTRQRVHDEGEAGVDGDGANNPSSNSTKTAEIARDVAPLLDRLGRMLTDVAPHLSRLGEVAEDRQASLSASAPDSGGVDTEPGEVVRRGILWHRPGEHRSNEWRSRRTSTAWTRSAQQTPSTAASPSSRQNASAYRQLVSTSSPAPTSSNINIHIHAIVPLRAPPSPPPPPPPPTASASTVATPTRAERPPLASAGSRAPMWGSHLDPAQTSLLAAARAAAASRPPGSSDTSESHTPRWGSGSGTLDMAGRGRRNSSDGESVGLDRSQRSGNDGNSTSTEDGRSSRLWRGSSNNTSLMSASSMVSGQGSSGDGQQEGSRGAATHPHLRLSAAVRGEPVSQGSYTTVATPPAGSDARRSEGAEVAHETLETPTTQGGNQRRVGLWRSFLRAFGVGGNNSSRVSGRRDSSEGESAS